MRVAILGRTSLLLDIAKALYEAGHEIPIIATCKAEDFYTAKEKDFQNFAEEINAHFFQTNSLNEAEVLEKLKTENCEIAVSLNWINIIKQDTISCFKRGILNIHCGDLPKYRGNACVNWAILNNEPFISVSVHEMIAEQLDSGPIFEKKNFPLTNQTSVTDVYNWLNDMLPALLVNIIDKLSTDPSYTAVKQSDNPADWLRCYPRKPIDSAINWDQDIGNILRLIRASTKPFSGAYCFLETGVMVRIWRAKEYNHEGAFLAVPGQVLICENGCPIIACANGCILLEEVTTDDGADARQLICKSLRNRLISYSTFLEAMFLQGKTFFL